MSPFKEIFATLLSFTNSLDSNPIPVAVVLRTLCGSIKSSKYSLPFLANYPGVRKFAFCAMSNARPERTAIARPKKTEFHSRLDCEA